MSASIRDIDFSALSSLERLQLAQSLLDSVLEGDAEPFSPQQLAELDKRVAEMDAGKAVFEPWEAVRAQLLNKQ